MLNRVRYNSDPQIIAFADMQEAPVSATVNATFISPDLDGRKNVPAGMWIARRKGSAELCFLPRATTTQATDTNSNTLRLNIIAPFVPGDKLYVIEPYASVSVTGVSVGQTLIITVNGRATTVTATTTSISDLINLAAQALLNSQVRAVPDTTNNKLYLFSKNKSEYPLTVTGTATASASDSKLTTPASELGTIQSINPTTKEVTLTGNAGYVLPVGSHIGSPVEDILGLNVHSHDFSTTLSKHINGLTGAIGVYQSALPYLDDEIKDRFPKMLFRSRF